jgi:archaemetzincin
MHEFYYTFFSIIIFFGFVGCQKKTETKETTERFNFNNLYKIHRRLEEPLPGEWREAHPEMIQSVESYVQKYTPLSTRNRQTIYLLPIGDFDQEKMDILSRTREYTEIFYGMNTKLMDAMSVEFIPDSARRYHLNTEQLHTKYILYHFLKQQIPDDGYAMFAITEKDLYPREGWNFVFGQASLKDKVGVASIFRLDDKNNKQLFARRIMKTVAHELGHISHIKHCQKHACLMNGSNSLAEADKRPIWLCPACLYKLTWFLGYEVEERYNNLHNFYLRFGLEKEALFIEKSLRIGLMS